MDYKVFINYRRSDTQDAAGRLHDRLETILPSADLFIDVDSVDKGENFVTRMKAKVAEADVVLAVIGPRWADARDEDAPEGPRRLDDPADPVRIELEDALVGGKIVLPVLVGRKTDMPNPRQLPEPLQPLAQLNAERVSHETFAEDVRRLSGAIANAVGKRAQEIEKRAEERRRLETRQRAEAARQREARRVELDSLVRLAAENVAASEELLASALQEGRLAAQRHKDAKTQADGSEARRSALARELEDAARAAQEASQMHADAESRLQAIRRTCQDLKLEGEVLRRKLAEAEDTLRAEGFAATPSEHDALQEVLAAAVAERASILAAPAPVVEGPAEAVRVNAAVAYGASAGTILPSRPILEGLVFAAAGPLSLPVGVFVARANGWDLFGLAEEGDGRVLSGYAAVALSSVIVAILLHMRWRGTDRRLLRALCWLGCIVPVGIGVFIADVELLNQGYLNAAVSAAVVTWASAAVLLLVGSGTVSRTERAIYWLGCMGFLLRLIVAMSDRYSWDLFGLGSKVGFEITAMFFWAALTLGSTDLTLRRAKRPVELGELVVFGLGGCAASILLGVTAFEVLRDGKVATPPAFVGSWLVAIGVGSYWLYFLRQRWRQSRSA